MDQSKHMNVVTSCWPFTLDTVHNWAYTNVFTPEECKKIIEVGNNLPFTQGTVGDTATFADSIRRCSVSWIYPTAENAWMFRIMTDSVQAANSTYFNFHLSGFQEGFQFTKYEATGEKYLPHIDKMMGNRIRKLSVSVQLTDSTEYEGGDFIPHLSSKTETAPKEQGMGIFFPSYVLHEVTPVTKGTRYSLVAWVTGDNFR
jgi:PKHD-type hydroxylase